MVVARNGDPFPLKIGLDLTFRAAIFLLFACVSATTGLAMDIPADAILGEFVRAWSVDCARAYDVFEIPPFEMAEAKAKRDAILKNYSLVVSSAPYDGARTIGANMVGKACTRDQLKAYRQTFREQISKENK